MTDHDRVPEDKKSISPTRKKKRLVIGVTLALCIIAVAVTVVLLYDPPLIPTAPDWLEEAVLKIEIDDEGYVTGYLLDGKRKTLTFVEKSSTGDVDFYEDEKGGIEGFYTGTAIPWSIDRMPRSARTEKINEGEALAIAHATLRSVLGIESFDVYDITIERGTDGESYIVCYDYRIQGFYTGESIEIQLYANGDIDRILNRQWGEYSCYPKVTKRDIQKGIASLKEQSGDPDLDYYYLDIDSEGYLCLMTEIIGPPDTSHEHESNCGHGHYFYTYRLSREPNPKKGDAS